MNTTFSPLDDRVPSPHPAWPALDLLKCFGVLGMVLVHGFFWSWSQGGRLLPPSVNAYGRLVEAMMFLGFLPLMLPLLAGATFRLRLGPERSAQPSFHLPMLFALCACLAALGYAMNVLAAGWYALWAWNVLQLIAVAFLLIGVLYAWRSVWPVAVFALLVLLLSDPLRGWLPAESRGGGLRVLLGDPDDWHTWPFFPWFGSVAFGFVLAHVYLRVGACAAFRWGCTTVGAGLVVLAAAAGRLMPAFDPDNLIGPRLMQPPTVTVLGLLGVLLLLVAVLTAIQGRVRLTRYGLVRAFGAGILWIYMAHIIVGLRLSRMIYTQVDQASVVADPWTGWHPLVLVGFPLMLLLVSWLVGYVTLRWLHEKRLTVRLRKVQTSQV